jgi:hypothetical protein
MGMRCRNKGLGRKDFFEIVFFNCCRLINRCGDSLDQPFYLIVILSVFNFTIYSISDCQFSDLPKSLPVDGSTSKALDYAISFGFSLYWSFENDLKYTEFFPSHE